MKSVMPERQWGSTVVTGVFLMLLAIVGSINLAWSGSVTPQVLIRKTNIPSEVRTERRDPVPGQAELPGYARHGSLDSNAEGLMRPSGQPKSLGLSGSSNSSAHSSPVKKLQGDSRIPAATGDNLEGFKARLPAYYSQLVTPQQRERIYWIQKRYFVEIQKYLKHIEKLEAERDTYIHNCLLPDQKQRLLQLQGRQE